VNARRRRVVRALAIVAIAALAFGLRWRALERLPIDYDEPWCLEAAQQIAELLRAGELRGLTELNPTPEHPQLAKAVLAVSILPAPESAPSPQRRSVYLGAPGLPEAQLLAARTGSAVLGTLAVALLAILGPLAGFFLAIHTYTVKFTSHAMLEALPALLSLAAVASYLRFKQGRGMRWLAGSAVALGLTAAAKYLYAIVGVVILVDWALTLRPAPASRLSRTGALALLWGVASLGVFFAATPYFWPAPFARLEASVSYLAGYSAGTDVREADFPMWQPLAWLAFYLPDDAPAERPYLLRLDPLISALALVGLVRTWRRERTWVLWLGIGLGFLLLWNTKWPHYVVIIAAPLCMCAQEGARLLLGLPPRAWRRLRGRVRPAPSAA
jgi:hypothetical protein